MICPQDGQPCTAIGLVPKAICQQSCRLLAAQLGRFQVADGRDIECVAAWPECQSGGYDPRCCRFPKSCSCGPRGILDSEAKVCFNSPVTNEPIMDSILAPNGGWKTETTHPIFDCSDCNRAVGAAIGIAQHTGSVGSGYGDDEHHAKVTWIPALLPMQPVRIPIHFTDLRAALRHDAETAEREGFRGVAERARSILGQLAQADADMVIAKIHYTVEIVISPVVS